jgi:Sulfotransferase domain
MNQMPASPRNPFRTPVPFIAARKAIWARTLSGVLPIYLVNEYPKSGGTWLKMMLAEALGLPAWTRYDPVWTSCVMQAHWLKPTGLVNTVALLRDGRDVMVSYYHHSFFENEHFNGDYVARMRASFAFGDFGDVRTNLLPFMRRMLETPVSPGFSWVDFVETWARGPARVVTRYEDLRSDTPGELQRIFNGLGAGSLPRERAEQLAELYSMGAMRERNVLKRNESARPQGEFIRKGSVGGWTEYFSDEALEYFETKAGHALQLAGYRLGRPGACA